MTNVRSSKRLLWILALAPMIAGLVQLSIQQSSLALLMVHGQRLASLKPAQAAPEAELIREVHGDIKSSVLMTSIALLWAPFAYRLLSRRLGNESAAKTAQTS